MYGHEVAELKPKLTEQEFEIKRASIMAEMDEVIKKYDIHGLVFSFGVESGEAMKAAVGVLGCSECCVHIFEQMVRGADRIKHRIAEGILSGGGEVH